VGVKPQLDHIDWKILQQLQANGRISNVDLSRAVGISAPPCLRRVRALEEAGIIEGYVAQFNEKAIGFELMAFAMVSLTAQSEMDLMAFEAQCQEWALVRSCYMLSGEVDFILQCVAPDLGAFQNFIIKELTATANVAGVKTSLVIRRSKFLAGGPIEVLAIEKGL